MHSQEKQTLEMN